MPTLEDLRSRVERIVKDSTYFGDVADSFINEAYNKVVGTVLIPDLVSSGLITTNPTANSVAIPSAWNFDRNVYLCSLVSDKKPIKVASSIAMLSREYPDYGLDVCEGAIEICTATRSAFVYYKSPAEAVILNCAFYKKHTPLANDTDVPSILPEHLHYTLLVSGAAYEIFTEIEEGNDGVMINTNKYRKKFEDAIEELKTYLKVGQSRPAPLRKKDWI